MKNYHEKSLHSLPDFLELDYSLSMRCQERPEPVFEGESVEDVLDAAAAALVGLQKGELALDFALRPGYTERRKYGHCFSVWMH